MFWICSMAAESQEISELVQKKISAQPNGNEKDFLAHLVPAINEVLDQYNGLAGVTIGGEISSRRATINITIYANELGE